MSAGQICSLAGFTSTQGYSGLGKALNIQARLRLIIRFVNLNAS